MGDQRAHQRRLRRPERRRRRLHISEIEHDHRRTVEQCGRRDRGRQALGCDLDQLGQRRIVAAQCRRRDHRAGVVAGHQLADDGGAAFERLDQRMAAHDPASGVLFSRHHQRIDHGCGDRRIDIAARRPHHLVQALGLAHCGQAVDLAGEQAGRRTAVGCRRVEFTDQDLELQIAQRAATRGGLQRRDQPLGRAERCASPGIGWHAAGTHREKARRAVVEIGGLCPGCQRDGRQAERHGRQETSAQSVHWAREPRNGALAGAAR